MADVTHDRFDAVLGAGRGVALRPPDLAAKVDSARSLWEALTALRDEPDWARTAAGIDKREEVEHFIRPSSTVSINALDLFADAEVSRRKVHQLLKRLPVQYVEGVLDGSYSITDEGAISEAETYVYNRLGTELQWALAKCETPMLKALLDPEAVKELLVLEIATSQTGRLELHSDGVAPLRTAPQWAATFTSALAALNPESARDRIKHVAEEAFHALA